MTHSYQFLKSTPYSRRKLNSAFVHALKKLCGGKFGIHVNVVLGDDEYGDYVWVYDKGASIIFKNKVLALCSRYGIGSDYILSYENLFDGGEYINIYLSEVYKP